MAKLIDGKAVAAEIREGLKTRCKQLSACGIVPGLAVILVGDDPASKVYVRNKERACASVGIHTETFRYPAETEMDELKARIDALNADDAFDGILLQLPLPDGLNADELLERIDPAKDVDGFHPLNFGKLALGLGGKTPCRPGGRCDRALAAGRQTDGASPAGGRRDGNDVPFAHARSGCLHAARRYSDCGRGQTGAGDGRDDQARRGGD